MKLNTLQENLAAGLAMVTRAVSRRSVMPILSAVLLKAEAGKLQLMGTDLEMMILCPVGARIEEEGAIAVPAHLLLELVKGWPAEVISLDVEDQLLHIRCGRFKAHLNGLSADEFPIVPDFPSDAQMDMDAELLRRMIKQVAFAAAEDEPSRPVLNGVLFTLGAQCTMTATDGYRLSVYSSEVPRREESPTGMSGEEGQAEAEDASVQVIVPARALTELARLCTGEEPVVMAVAEGDRIFFQHQGVMLTSQLIAGHFPDIQQVVPTGWKTRVEVDRTALLQAVRMAGVLAEGKAIRLSFTPEDPLRQGLVTVAGSGEVGEHVGEIEARVEGEGLSLALAAGYLSAPLSCLDADRVVLEGNSPTCALVIRPSGDEKENYLHLMMPLHLQEEKGEGVAES